MFLLPGTSPKPRYELVLASAVRQQREQLRLRCR